MSTIDGSWACVVNSPMGRQEGTLNASTAGGGLTGSYSTAMGTLQIENGKVDGSRATWTMQMVMPMPMKLEVEVSVDGDTMTGSIKAGAFGASPMTATRKA